MNTSQISELLLKNKTCLLSFSRKLPQITTETNTEKTTNVNSGNDRISNRGCL